MKRKLALHAPRVMRRPCVAIVMGSDSDWPTMKICSETLEKFGIKSIAEVVSAHRTPKKLFKFAQAARKNGFDMIIAGAGGAAHLPGMIASMTTLPVLGVPIRSKSMAGLDSLLSIAQMPAGVPVATFAVGEAGAKNAALFAAAILSSSSDSLRKKLDNFRKSQTKKVMAIKLK